MTHKLDSRVAQLEALKQVALCEPEDSDITMDTLADRVVALEARIKVLEEAVIGLSRAAYDMMRRGA